MPSLPDPTIIILDLPPKTFVGINLTSFNSSPNFHGITRLPEGLHFVYTGTDASLSIRHGRWLNIEQPRPSSQSYVLRWNTDLEHLDLLPSDGATARDVLRSVPELQRRGLVDYSTLRSANANLQADQSKTTVDPWPRLTSHVSPRLLSRVLKPAASTDTASQSWSLTSTSSAPGDTEHIPGLSASEAASVLSPSANLDLLPVDLKQTWPDDAIGRDRTEKARDRSWYLGHLISTLSAAGNGTEEVSQRLAAGEVLGELQFTFLMVLTLANYSCLEQWKRLLSVLFTCRTALVEAEAYFVQVVKVLREQLGRVEDVEGGLFEMGDEMGSRWLRQLLRTFRGNVVEMGAQEVKKALEELDVWLGEEYGWEDEKNLLRKGMVQLEDGEMVEVQVDGWDEEEEMGEYAPVIVET
ncbi:hypothetical protein H2198_005030 [Neophaeococcomyces mojaviensis]|uniref:Uncharacterized protein n=1 Tax=Neophaeococcomyces mojaviensis TaxID=3383035 RepID=A0ACC3A6W8_9EURO|nr:hypothetical protein H2198_005030 [Knufia sp. JES_112]